MMGFMIYMIIMIPMVFIKNSWLMMQIMYLFLFLFFVLSINTNIFFGKISYFYGVDLFSSGLVAMSFLISLLMIVSMVNTIHMYLFLFINLSLTLFLYVIFTSLNFLYMYMSFEFVLVPLMVLILGWGYQPERLLAGLYLFLYTLVVSLPLLGLIMFLQITEGCLFFDYMLFHSNFFFIHFILVIVFMVKLPMFMAHFWLPKAHVQAPVSGSMILAGLMLKIGGYGLIRTMFMYEYMYITYSYFWYSFSMVGALMIAMICLIQGDIKSMIAYSSVSHMGMVVMGLMTLKWWGLVGSYLLMLAHGFCSSGMFYLANLVYSRSMSRSFYLNKGLIVYMPSCSMFYFIYCSFNMSCPPSLNFLSEAMILISMMHFWNNSMLFFIGISFFCACFSYYLYSYSQHGMNHNLYSFSNINVLEFLGLFMHLLPLLLLPLTIMSMI